MENIIEKLNFLTLIVKAWERLKILEKGHHKMYLLGNYDVSSKTAVAKLSSLQWYISFFCHRHYPAILSSWHNGSNELEEGLDRIHK